MKRYIVPSLLAVFLAILMVTTVAYANDAATTSRAKPRGFNLPFERKDATTTTERREELKTRFDEFRKQKINAMIAAMKRRFMAAIERLRGIADRIEARIVKIEDESDKDLTDAKNYLDEARDHLDEAEDALTGVGTTSADLFSDATSTGERFGYLRGLFADAKEHIKLARESLGKALRALGWFRGSDKATTTTQ